jgi:hypothetical protein
MVTRARETLRAPLYQVYRGDVLGFMQENFAYMHLILRTPNGPHVAKNRIFSHISSKNPYIHAQSAP